MPAARTRGAEGSASKAKPRSDAYVGLLALSLLALSAAMVFAYLDYSSYPESKPKPVQIAPRAGGGPAPVGGPAMNPPQGAPPGVPGAPPAPPAGMQGNQPPPAGVQGRPAAPQAPQPKQ
jgi:hypothetical protein